MLATIARGLFGTANERYLKRLKNNVEAINGLEAALELLSDDELRARTAWLRDRVAGGERLDDVLDDAFATVREAAKRTLGQRHFDVQLLGGIVLHNGMIAEMKTGEGKTLVATLAVYLNALEGKGVHIVTVNDYLARRDAAWMGSIYQLLGLTVGCIVPGLSHDERRAAYAADVTYGTNNEFGFDYLRDNMAFRLPDMVQRDFNYAIVDEVDSILVDEARTPLIISGPAEESSELYGEVDRLIPKLGPDDFEKDEKARAVSLTEPGAERMEELLTEAGILKEGGMYDIDNVSILHHVNQALRAHKLFRRDTDYIVKNGKVVIIDEYTGRMMEGRRFSEGLHQALEAKEHVAVQTENQTLASITFQNYFRLYPKLAGMTGTAMTESAEFADIYKLEIVDIPTHLDCVREDGDDEVYRTVKEKEKAVLDLIEDCHSRGQPTLVGTITIEKSERLAALLKKRKIPHNVLNARYHEQEAHIIAQAGAPGTVTIATNMAGRGTDIQLGGNVDMRLAQELTDINDDQVRDRKAQTIRDEVTAAGQKAKDAGGLCVIGTERHESRRIDNQLRGRSGRQGDPGASRFFLSLEDDLMRIFGSERMDTMLQKLGLEEGEAIVHPWINKALEKAQQKVETRNFDARKYVLQYDDTMNDQRKVVYEQRRELMHTEDVSETVADMRTEVIGDLVARCIPPKAFAEQWDTHSLHEEVLRIFGLDLPIADWAQEDGIADQEIGERLTKAVDQKWAQKVANYGPDVMKAAQKSILLQILDMHWKDHLLRLDHLRQGIGLRAYGQRNPLNEYKREAFEMFDAMLGRLRESVTTYLCHLEIRLEAPPELPRQALPRQARAIHQLSSAYAEEEEFAAAGANGAGPPARPVRRSAASVIDSGNPDSWGKVPRNSPCPCKSGRKYKHCHGRLA